MNLPTTASYLRIVSHYKQWSRVCRARLNGTDIPYVHLRNGLKISAPRRSTLIEIINEIFFEHVYTPKDLPIDAGDTVIDVGANIGMFSLFAAHAGAACIYAYEPFPTNFEYFQSNMRMNNVSCVHAVNAAVCDAARSQRLYLSEISGGHLLFDRNINGPLNSFVNVPTTTLTNIVQQYQLRQIDFLKLDCEGSEGLILRSTAPDVLRCIRKIAMEFHDNVSPLSHESMESLLRSAGFVTRTSGMGSQLLGTYTQTVCNTVQHRKRPALCHVGSTYYLGLRAGPAVTDYTRVADAAWGRHLPGAWLGTDTHHQRWAIFGVRVPQRISIPIGRPLEWVFTLVLHRAASIFRYSA
jgi:FkbM family methyltransferase